MKKRSKQVRRSRKAPFVSVVEQMEPRQLLSGSAFVEAGGRLVVRGTNGNDTITVTAKAGDASKLSVVVNGTVREFASRGVSNVKIEAGDGNDKVQADTRNGAVNQGIFFLGGRGNDTLISTTGNDAMVGEGGDDVLVGTTGNNFLNGGIGNDKIYAGAGNDTLNGEAGNDYLHNAGGKDQIVTGPGSNTVVTAAIPSNIPGVGAVAVGSPGTELEFAL